jgi:hypothetical protein
MNTCVGSSTTARDESHLFPIFPPCRHPHASASPSPEQGSFRRWGLAGRRMSASLAADRTAFRPVDFFDTSGLIAKTAGVVDLPTKTRFTAFPPHKQGLVDRGTRMLLLAIREALAQAGRKPWRASTRWSSALPPGRCRWARPTLRARGRIQAASRPSFHVRSITSRSGR